ncbi:MAG TPA: AAA family ATPase, partial [Gemmatimonadales bacterium]|nr:AAA family ATPase [Gemmatimonadales bacterium]
TDIYSLGCVLYEMLAGRPPYQGTSTQAIIVKLFTESIPPLGTLRESLPAWLEDVVATSVAKNPEERYPTAARFADALRRRPVESIVPTPPVHVRGRTVGRGTELASMRRVFEIVASGHGRMLAVSGEPGIGKTALVEDFLGGVIRSPGCIMARGRCSERLAGTEAYLPLLEALQSLLEAPSRSWMTSSMKRLAPSWYAEVATSETPTAETSLLQAVSQERMKRELVGFIQEVARQQPLVLFLDDVHWADASTVDMLAYLGTRLENLKVLIVATHRPAELALTGNPFRALKMHLMARQQCEELTLGFLDRSGLDALIAAEFPRHGFPATFTSLILGKTEGNPLFVVEVLRQLRRHGAIVESGDTWILAGSPDDLGGEIPSSIKSTIERAIDQIEDEDRKLLAAASPGGERFDTAILADVLDASPESIEERVERLEKAHGLVRRLGDGELPDGTPTVRYGFVHALYHDAFLQSLTLSRRVALSGATAAAIERRYGSHASDVAGVLALLFESARNWDRAVHYFVLAARHAAHTFAHFELETLCRRGLALLKHLPQGPARDQADLELSASLGRGLTILRGFAAPEVEQLYSHARELCERLTEPRQQITALAGLWEYYEVRGNLATARTLAREILALAETSGDDGLLVKSYDVLADTLHYAGEFADSVDFAERGIRLYDPARHRGLAQEFGSYDPGVACRSEGALALWRLGQEERARRMSEEGYALARRLNHPFSIALSLAYATWLDVYRRDPVSVAHRAAELGAFCLENGFAFFHAESIILLGWAEARNSEAPAGVDRIRHGIQLYRSTGALLDMPLWCGLLADA